MLDSYCQQLGYIMFVSAEYGGRSCSAPAGMVFWGSGYEEDTWHWCDYDNGFWKDDTLDYHNCDAAAMIQAITCAG